MGAHSSTQNGENNSPRARTFSTSSSSEVVSGTSLSLLNSTQGSVISGDRQRARSLSSVTDSHSSPEVIGITNTHNIRTYDISESPETDSSSEDHVSDSPLTANLSLDRILTAHSLPSHISTLNEEKVFGLLPRVRNWNDSFGLPDVSPISTAIGIFRGKTFRIFMGIIIGSCVPEESEPVETDLMPTYIGAHSLGIKCPICAKFLLPDDIECHLVMCLTKPFLIYNEDVLSEDKGECVICFEDLTQGDTIARLPCLCIYHKGCIDKWFNVNRSCPEHPGD